MLTPTLIDQDLAERTRRRQELVRMQMGERALCPWQPNEGAVRTYTVAAHPVVRIDQFRSTRGV